MVVFIYSLRSSASSLSPFEKKSPGGRSSDSVTTALDVLPFHGDEEKSSGYKGNIPLRIYVTHDLNVNGT